MYALRSAARSFVAIDVETTGLPRRGNYDNCRVLSLAIVEYDRKFRETKATHRLIYPDTFEVRASEIHGITQEAAETEGIPFVDAYNELLRTILLCPTVVGHNLQFDIKAIRAEAKRRGLDIEPLDRIEPMCTLDLVKKVYGFPMKLGILYEKLFDKELEGAHNALADSRAAGEVYIALKDDPRKIGPIKPKKIYIRASDVAACVGCHQFKKPQEVLDTLHMRYSPETFRGSTGLEILQTNKTARKIVNIATDSKSSNLTSLIYHTSQMIDMEDFGDEEKSNLKEYIRKKVYTNYGIRTEDTTAQRMGTHLIEDNTFYKQHLINICGTDYVLCGRIDRIQIEDDGSKTLIEIKNRTRGLFRYLRKYEAIQVQTYLQLTGLTNAQLVECYDEDIHKMSLTRNDSLWFDEILPKLENFCKTLHNKIYE